jgi:hypothetical protein
MKLYQRAGLNTEVNIAFGIEAGQRDKDELHQLTLAGVSMSKGHLSGAVRSMTRHGFALFLVQGMLDDGENVIATRNRGDSNIQKQIESCHESQHVANAFGVRSQGLPPFQVSRRPVSVHLSCQPQRK